MFFYYSPCASVRSSSHQGVKKPWNSCMSWGGEGCAPDYSTWKQGRDGAVGRHSAARLWHL